MTYDPKDYWNKRGVKYEAPGEKDDETDNLKKIVNQSAGFDTMFLEVGSGYGRICNELKTVGFVDIVEVDCECKKRGMPLVFSNYTMCDFVLSMREHCFLNTGILPDYWDGKTLPYHNNQFDFVISFSVLLHVPPCEIDRVFAEHVRVCKKHLFVATYAGGLERLAGHCFEHDYRKLFEKYDLKIVDEKFFQNGLRVNWLLEK